MGSFMGHEIAGFNLLMFSFWWTIQIFRRYKKCIEKNEKFKSSVSFDWKADNFVVYPLEDSLKVLCSFFAVIGEIVGGLEISHFPIENLHHITIHSFFGVSAIFNILFIKDQLPKYLYLDYLTFLMAFGIELFLLTFHIVGDHNMLQTMVHKFLSVAVLGTLVCGLIEALYRHVLLAALGRTYFTMIQGTWLLHIGFILYSPFQTFIKEHEESDGESMMVAAFFIWHCIAVFLGMFFIGLITMRKAKANSRSDYCYLPLTDAMCVENAE